MDEEKINPGHEGIRSILRLVGPAMILLGGLFMAVGLISFFSAFGGGGMPRYFWCCFVGMPILGIGVAITKFAFVGAVARYIAAESAPVGKDTFNYMAKGTKSGVRDITSAISEGISGTAAGKTCQSCNAQNDHDARFCDACGANFNTAIVCSACSAENDGAARYCNECGTQLRPAKREH